MSEATENEESIIALQARLDNAKQSRANPKFISKLQGQINELRGEPGRLSERLEWVPTWVWEGYQQLVISAESPLAVVWHGDRASLFYRLVTARKCEIVWKAMGKRYKQANKRFHGDWPPPAELQTDGPDRITVPSLANTISAGLAADAPATWMTKTERAECSQKIVDLAAQLRAQLMHISSWPNGHISLPNEIRDELTSLGGELTDGYRETLKRCDEEAQPVNDFDPEAAELGHLAGVWEMALNFTTQLSAVECGALAWGKSSPVVARPNRSNARRLYFVRTITNWFREYYGTPLRECTLAITSVFFDCSDLNANDIAKLAPVDDPERK